MKISKKRTKNKPSAFRYKLTEMELDRLAYRGVISLEERDLLIRASKLREPHYYANARFQLAMNKKGTIMLNSINRNGGDNFNEPYHFLAEFTHKTSPSVFTRFVRQNQVPLHPFTS